jgi:hypothetical protein
VSRNGSWFCVAEGRTGALLRHESLQKKKKKKKKKKTKTKTKKRT